MVAAPEMDFWIDHNIRAILCLLQLQARIHQARMFALVSRSLIQNHNAKHAFAKETADSKNLPFLKHDSAAAELAWRRTMDFFAKHLK